MNQSQITKTVESALQARERYYNAYPKKETEKKWDGKIKTSQELLDEAYYAVVNTAVETESGDKIKYQLTINGRTVSTPWLTDQQWDKITRKQWEVFINAFSTEKRLLKVNAWIVSLQNGVVSYPGDTREPDHVVELFAQHGMEFTSVADLIEYHLLGGISDTSLAAKKAWRDARDAKRAAVEAAKKPAIFEPKESSKPAVTTPHSARKHGQGKGFTMPAWKVEQICGSKRKF